MSGDLVEMPQWVACLAQWLRAEAEVTDVIDGDAIHSTKLPGLELRTYPVVLVRLITDPDRLANIHYLVGALFQVDVWANTADDAWRIAARLRAVLSQRLAHGRQTVPAGSFVASNVQVGGVRPDTATSATADATSNAEREHARFDLTVSLHP